jgi:tetratricopeptide (TPR) repeat protein
LGVSLILERTSGNVRRGINLIDDENFNPFEVSELASAIATLEMFNANSKGARKLFRKALRQPTENSIAQAVWASHITKQDLIKVQNFDAPLKFEALARSFYETKEWSVALNQGKGWILDQPFAVTPVLFTGHVASIIEDFEIAARIYTFGLMANPSNTTLLNNLAFVLASDDKPGLAERELGRIDKTSLSDEEQIVITATEGLINFRKRNIVAGRELYRRAIEKAKEHKQAHLALRAFMFLAREEINAGTDEGQQALGNAETVAKGTSPPEDLKILMKKLQKLVESDPIAFSVVRQLGERHGLTDED